MLAKVKEVLNDASSAMTGNPAVVLVGDQDENRKKNTTGILRENGYAVLTAGSVEEAEVVSAPDSEAAVPNLASLSAVS